MTFMTNVELPSQKQTILCRTRDTAAFTYIKKIRNHIVPENRNKIHNKGPGRCPKRCLRPNCLVETVEATTPKGKLNSIA